MFLKILQIPAMNNEVVSLILSGVITFATVCYTVINLMMWLESRSTRYQKLAPQVIPYLGSTASKITLCLFIKNVGEGCAKDVKVKILKDYNCFGKKDYRLSDFPIFKDGVNIFPSGYELHYYLNSWEEIVRNDSDKEYIELEISCSDIKGQKQKPQRYRLEFNQIRSNYSTPPETYEGQIAYYLNEIHKDLKK